MTRRKFALTVGAVGLVAAVGLIAYRGLTRNAGAADRARAADEAARVSVRTVHPKRDPNFRIANEQVAWVEPFYQAGLRPGRPGSSAPCPRRSARPSGPARSW